MNRQTNKREVRNVPSSEQITTNETKEAPIIYAYIYEREPSDLEKLYKSHHNAKINKDAKLISGFEFIGNELIAKTVEKKTK